VLPGGLACIYKFVRDTYKFVRDTYEFVRDIYEFVRDTYGFGRDIYEFVRECILLRKFRPSSARGRRVLPGGLACIYEYVRDTYEFVRELHHPLAVVKCCQAVLPAYMSS